MKKKWLPDNVTEYSDRHGKKRYRFRKKGLPTYHFKYSPGSDEFITELNLARQSAPIKHEKFRSGTIDAACHSFMQTARWHNVTLVTQRRQRSILDKLRQRTGSMAIADLQTVHIDKWMAAMHETPSAANTMRKTLIALCNHAIKLGWITSNPATPSDRYKIKSDGFYSWSEDDIAQYRRHWNYGTRQRLAMELMLNTGLRSIDACKLTRSTMRDGLFYIKHGKNGLSAILPIFKETQYAIDAIQNNHLIFITTQYGKPFTTKGFGNWFNESADKAGLPQCTCHGLKKAFARRLADSGATDQQGMAAAGTATPAMFAHYAKAANKEAMSKHAMANVGNKFGEPKEKL